MGNVASSRMLTIVRTHTGGKKKSRDGKDSRLFFHALTLTGGVAILGL